MIGTNRDELTLFGLGNPALFAMDEKGLERWVANAVPGIPPLEVIEAYREARQARGERIEVNDVWVAAGTDIVFRWPSLQLAAAHQANGGNAFVYLFDWESPAFDGLLGSCHALELPFVFGAVHVPVVQLFSGGGPPAETLSRQMQMAWLDLCRAGDPSHEGIGEWRQWEPAERRHHGVRCARAGLSPHRVTVSWRCSSATGRCRRRPLIRRRPRPTRRGRWRMPEWRLLRVHSTGPASSYQSNAPQDLLERDADLQAGQVRAEAEVDAVAEREMRVGVTAEAERVGCAEAAVRRGWPSPPTPRPSARARSPGRRAGTARWPSGAWTATASSSAGSPRRRVVMGRPPARSRRELVGPIEEGEHGSGDRVAGRLGARREQQREERRQLLVAQPRRVLVGQLGVDDGGEHVGPRFGALLLDERAAVFVHAVERGLALGGHGEEVRLVGDVEDVLDRFEEEVPVGLGDAEQEADRLHRELGRHVDQEVELVAGRSRGGPASGGAARLRGPAPRPA